MGVFGPMTNIACCFSGVICLLLGLLLPDSPSDYKDDEYWRLIYGFPIIFADI